MEVGGVPLRRGQQSEWRKSSGRLVECRDSETTLQTSPGMIGNRGGGGCRYFMEWKMTSGETKRQEMTSGDIPVCRIPLLICFELIGREKRGGIPEQCQTLDI